MADQEQKYFLAKVKIRHGEHEFDSLLLLIAGSSFWAEKLLDTVCSEFYGGDVEAEDGHYLFCGGELAVSAGFVKEISEATFNELAPTLGATKDETLP